MKHSDKQEFKDLIDEVYDYYDKTRPSQNILKFYFQGLERFEVEQISNAVGRHMNDPTCGKFLPKISDLIKQLEGNPITVDMIVAAAKIHQTPLGVLCRIQIGTWDLDNQDDFFLRQRAHECLQLMPAWKARAVAGKYTAHEISIMIKHQVNPLSPFNDGIDGPQNPGELKLMIGYVCDTPRHKQLLEAPYRLDEESMKQLSPVASQAITEVLRQPTEDEK